MLKHKVLKVIVHLFDSNGIVWGLGGSCTMCLQGIIVEPHDIDLFVIPQDFEIALRLLSVSGTFTQQGPSGIFASQYYAHGTFMDCPIDLIAGFRIITPKKMIDYPFDVDRIVIINYKDISIPCCLLEDWIVLYEAMDKHVKADMIKRKTKQTAMDLR